MSVFINPLSPYVIMYIMIFTSMHVCLSIFGETLLHHNVDVRSSFIIRTYVRALARVFALSTDANFPRDCGCSRILFACVVLKKKVLV